MCTCANISHQRHFTTFKFWQSWSWYLVKRTKSPPWITLLCSEWHTLPCTWFTLTWTLQIKQVAFLPARRLIAFTSEPVFFNLSEINSLYSTCGAAHFYSQVTENIRGDKWLPCIRRKPITMQNKIKCMTYCLKSLSVIALLNAVSLVLV